MMRGLDAQKPAQVRDRKEEGSEKSLSDVGCTYIASMGV